MVRHQKPAPNGRVYNDKSQNLHDAMYVGGMCHSMSMYWLALKKKGGKDFFQWLKPSGTWNKGAINVLVVKTVMYKNNKNNLVSAGDHSKFDERFFSQYGLRPYGAKLKGSNNIKNYIDLKSEGFHMISLSGQGSGHAVAAQIKANGESSFFDPNYGEYTFPNPMFLGSFFKAFMQHAGYDTKYTVAQGVTTYR